MRPSWACAVRWDHSGRKGDIDVSEAMGDSPLERLPREEGRARSRDRRVR